MGGVCFFLRVPPSFLHLSFPVGREGKGEREEKGKATTIFRFRFVHRHEGVEKSREIFLAAPPGLENPGICVPGETPCLAGIAQGAGRGPSSGNVEAQLVH